MYDQFDNRSSLSLKELAEEQKLFSYLYRQLLPSLLAHGRQQGRSLRCWILGSDMEREAFWLAMQISDLLGDQLPDWTIKIFASEADPHALALARQGIYTLDQLISFPSAYQQRYFRYLNGHYQVSLAIRSLIVFALYDHSNDPPFPRIDLALAPRFSTRYSPDQQEPILARLASSLYPHGILFTNHQITSLSSSPYYEVLDTHWQVYRCLTTPLLFKQSLRRQQNRQDLIEVRKALALQIAMPAPSAAKNRDLLPAITAPDLLSRQEIRVLHYLATGLSNKEIAQNMVITEGTVKRHTGNIYRKLNVHTRLAAVTRAKSLKLLE